MVTFAARLESPVTVNEVTLVVATPSRSKLPVIVKLSSPPPSPLSVPANLTIPDVDVNSISPLKTTLSL